MKQKDVNQYKRCVKDLFGGINERWEITPFDCGDTIVKVYRLNLDFPNLTLNKKFPETMPLHYLKTLENLSNNLFFSSLEQRDMFFEVFVKEDEEDIF